MPAENPPGFPFPENQDPDRTVHYRTPQPSYGQPYGQPEGDQPTRMAYPGPAGQDDAATRMQYPGQGQQPQYGDQTRVDYPQNYQDQQYQNQQYGQQPYGQQPQYGQQPYQQQPHQQWQQPEELGYGLPPVQHAPQPKRGGIGRGWIIALIAAVLAGIVGGGGFYVVSALSGGGTQPHEVLPGSAFAYVRLDLDPAANQKLALFTIARKFNATKDIFSGDDPRQALFDSLAQSSPNFKGVDYAKDVAPWLGSRVGVAFSQPGKAAEGEPQAALGVAVAIQTSNEEATRAFLQKMDAKEKQKTGFAFRDGYVILAESQAEADKYADAPTLADNPDFSGDMAALGEPGVLSFWASAKPILESGMTGVVDQTISDRLKNGRFAGALRFDGDYAEITGITRGIDTTLTSDLEATRLGELPDSTAAAMSISGLGAVLSEQWTEILKASNANGGAQLNQFVAEAEQQFGLTLPDDLAALLGKSITVALDENGLDGNLPNVGTVLSTDPAKAKEVLEKVELAFANTGTPVQLAKKAGDGKLVVATTEEYAAKLAANGTLADSETFKLAIPNAADANFALYADLDKIEKLYLNSLQGEDRANLEALRAVGLSAQYSGSEVGFTLRLIFN
ncbi:hypothetical protein Acor_40400 [Acrocarpospora corrugata]|uniref:DUF3352 domain-containing protein n=1 Tax=Acrocarpospora corrugata TaxID=35763 RepID=A0A5M3VYU4_9ACTN|nr:DUF3352 domain-containing protein [Acrocarpospora corrugata]GES01975.1 hypothetical protein Acor_40400 [Acrocarpospora corrugata]